MKQSEVIIITGAAQRLGLYNAKALREQGYDVIISYRTPRRLIQELEAEGIGSIQADFSSPEGIDAFISAVRDCCSSLRAIIHNASVWYPDSDILSGKADMSDLVHVHMTAPFKINYSLQPLLLKAESPMKDIIHMTDFTVSRGSRNHAFYSGTKAALENMTLSFAAQFGPAIKVNSIAPALVKFNSQDSEEYRKAAEHKSIMGFEPGETVSFQALSYLLHNPYVTGTTLHIDGGRHLV